MRFVIGVVIGFAVGIAGAILFAPEKKKGPWPEGHPAQSLNGDQRGGLKGAIRTLQDHVNEAWEEARVAAEAKEKEMRAKLEEERLVGSAENERKMRAIYEEAAAGKKSKGKKSEKAEAAAEKEPAGRK
jgi:gas vesicle protein